MKGKDTDAEIIAKGLSEAHRRALKEMSEKLSWGEGWYGLRSRHPDLVKITETRPQCLSYSLTPLGLAVRSVLLNRGK